MSPDTILIIEDNIQDLALLQREIKEAGLKNPIQIVNDGDAAITLLEERVSVYHQGGPLVLPLFVLIDLNVPKANGFEVLDRIKKLPGLSRLVTIILSGSDMQDDLLLALELGAKAYILKPVTASDLKTLAITAGEMASSEWQLPAKLQKVAKITPSEKR